MINNEFQKIYRQIISQAPIFDTFDDQIIKPKLVKHNNDYYFNKMRDFAEIDLDKIVDKISDGQSNLLYCYLDPFQIYDVNASQDFNLFKIKSFDMNKYDTINGYDNYYDPKSNIALQFSIIQFMDLDLKLVGNYSIEDFVFNHASRLAGYEEDIEAQTVTMLSINDDDIYQYYEEKLNKDYTYDINKGGIVFIYSIVDLANEKILYFDHDIFENKKFLTGMIPHTYNYLKAKVKKYFKQKKVFDKIKKVLTQKLIEIKNNY